MDSVKAPRWVWATVVLVGVASIAASAKTSNDTGQTNDRLEESQQCLVAFMAENSRVSKVRSAATAEKDEAVNRVLNGVATLTLKPDPDPDKARAKYRQLLSDYQDAASKLRQERAKNPLPELPASCSDLD